MSDQPSASPGDAIPDPLVGTTVSERYLIEKRLGEGGMGAVYLARHVVIEKQVALKILHGEFTGRRDLADRFLHEAKAAARIRHEHVIDISDFGQTQSGNPFFCMELLSGHDLSGELKDNGPPSWPRIKHIILQTCSALQAAHNAGITHRDLKPENIFLIERLGHPDFVKVLDFGIAKSTDVEEGGKRLTKTGMVFGTPEYMSPEQARGDKTDHRVDIYAMGCILYQLVSGEVPFRAETFMGVLTRHLFEAVPPLSGVTQRTDLPAGLEAVIMQALEKDRDKRYGSMNELAMAIDALDHIPGVQYFAPGSRATSVAGAVMPSTASPDAATRIGEVAPTRSPAGSQPPAATANPTPAPITRFDGDEPLPKRPASRTPLIAAAAIVLVGGGLGAVLAMRGGGGGSQAAPPATPPAIADPATPTAPAGTPPVATPTPTLTNPAGTPPAPAAPDAGPAIAGDPTPVPVGDPGGSSRKPRRGDKPGTPTPPVGTTTPPVGTTTPPVGTTTPPVDKPEDKPPVDKPVEKPTPAVEPPRPPSEIKRDRDVFGKPESGKPEGEAAPTTP